MVTVCPSQFATRRTLFHVLRSEERFSRNAETDLVCRLLLEKKKLNHPQRRLAALAILTRKWPRLRRMLGRKSAVGANDFFSILDHPYWKFHYSLSAKASQQA